MTLSNRCWRAIASRVAECLEPVCCTLWTKVQLEAKGKRHYMRHITLTFPEIQLALSILRHPTDNYMAFVADLERAMNPGAF